MSMNAWRTGLVIMSTGYAKMFLAVIDVLVKLDISWLETTNVKVMNNKLSFVDRMKFDHWWILFTVILILHRMDAIGLAATCIKPWRLEACALFLTDINECTGANNCEQVCHNTVGSYYCSCRKGYVLASDNKKCVGKQAHLFQESNVLNEPN